MEKPNINNEPWLSNCCGVESPMPEFGICPRCKDNCVFTIIDEEGNETIFEP